MNIIIKTLSILLIMNSVCYSQQYKLSFENSELKIVKQIDAANSESIQDEIVSLDNINTIIIDVKTFKTTNKSLHIDALPNTGESKKSLVIDENNDVVTLLQEENQIRYKETKDLIPKSDYNAVEISVINSSDGKPIDKVTFKFSTQSQLNEENPFLINLKEIEVESKKCDSINTIQLISNFDIDLPGNIFLLKNSKKNDRGYFSLYSNYKKDEAEYEDALKIIKSENTIDEKIKASKIFRSKKMKVKAGTMLNTVVTNYNPRLYAIKIAVEGLEYEYEVSSHPLTDLLSLVKIPSLSGVSQAIAEATTGVEEIKQQAENLAFLNEAITINYNYLNNSYDINDCMIEAYLYMLVKKMERNQIPTDKLKLRTYVEDILSNFDDQQDKKVKEALEKLPTVYEALWALNELPPQFVMQVPYQDELTIKLEIQDRKNQSATSTVGNDSSEEKPKDKNVTNTYSLNIVGGLKVNASANILWYGLGRKYDGYYLQDTLVNVVDLEGQIVDSSATRYIIRNQTEKQNGLALGAQLNAYYKFWTGINPAFSIGLGYDVFSEDENKLKMNLGVGTLINTRDVRVGFHVGLIWGNKKVLATGFKVNQYYELENREVPLQSKFSYLGPYVGISINPKIKIKS